MWTPRLFYGKCRLNARKNLSPANMAKKSGVNHNLSHVQSARKMFDWWVITLYTANVLHRVLKYMAVPSKVDKK